jgi:hypothetical protein
MHPNEIKLTDVNFDALLEEAMLLGSLHVAALKEQLRRQTDK